jgi:hypothetical protein
MRSAPDSRYNNNWSTSPNINPYTANTGQQGDEPAALLRRLVRLRLVGYIVVSVDLPGCAARRLRLGSHRLTSAFRVDVPAGVETRVSRLVPCPNRGRSVPLSVRPKSWHPPNRLQASISLHGSPRSSGRTPLNDYVTNVSKHVGVVSLDNASRSRGGVCDAERAAPAASSCPLWPSTCRLRAVAARRRQTHRPPDTRISEIVWLTTASACETPSTPLDSARSPATSRRLGSWV